MAIYITGDLHGGLEIDKLSTDKFVVEKLLSKDDVLIVAGDFGLVNKLRSSSKWLQYLSDKPYTVLFVDGNHEDFELLLGLPEKEMFGGKVGVVRDHIYHLKRGEFYSINGINVFVFGGALSIDRQYRILGQSYWKEEIPSWNEMEKGKEQLRKIAPNVDLIITHTCPASVLGSVIPPKLNFGEDEVPNYLEELRSILDDSGNRRYKWFFGHFHKDIEIDHNFIAVFDDIKLYTR